jgi:peptidoglycan lytic transglycosylase G
MADKILSIANRWKYAILGAAAVLIVAFGGMFAYGLRPADASGTSVIFSVVPGEKFQEIVVALRSEGLIRSTTASEFYAILSGAAFRMQPGLYKLSPAMSASAILGALATKAASEVTVTIPEGDNIYQIDAALANALVLPPGAFAAYASENDLEGKLFPDTYQFFTGSGAEEVAQKMMDDFDAKAAPLLAADPKNATSDLIIASILEKEVPDPTDQKIVSGILWKRLNAGMPLDVDASICYAKLMEEYPSSTLSANVTAATDTIPSCYPLAPTDYTVNSPYNTYRYKGLPPGPIGNPGVAALTAAINPQKSPYWYYLSDPATGKTVYAVTLDEQNANRVEYLKSH